MMFTGRDNYPCNLSDEDLVEDLIDAAFDSCRTEDTRGLEIELLQRLEGRSIQFRIQSRKLRFAKKAVQNLWLQLREKFRLPGKVYYVGAGGDDSNDGLTWKTRKATLRGVEDVPLRRRDTVYVGTGRYTLVI